MDFLHEGFLCKAKRIVSSICKIMSWTSSTLSFPMQTLNQFPPHDHEYLQHHHLGLKTLIPSHKENSSNNIIHSFTILPPPPPPPPPSPSSSSSSSSSSSTSMSMSSSLSSSSSSSLFGLPSTSSWSSMMGDLIGSESGVYTSSNADELDKIDHQPYKCSAGGSKRNQRYYDGMMKKTKKEYPPPIPLLAQTGNLPGHMPWVLTRHYIDGRLILKEKRVEHHDYFEAHRVNGRLILTLVPLDNSINCCHAACDYNARKINDYEKLKEPEEEEDHVESEDKDDDGAVMKETSMAIVASPMPKSCGERWASTISSDSNFFGMTIPMNAAVPT